MSDRPRTTAERWARFQRDQETYRRISLARQTYARFRRDLAVVPHVFLLLGRARSKVVARLGQFTWKDIDTDTFDPPAW
ncbi:MAG TPA: hypothetical protein VHB47_07520 [Thermoanaerobaculia bacterium]|jgi:hypothetical protein|nr:hypothetical protein [Thermoanaerobaculia bacterium]